MKNNIYTRQLYQSSDKKNILSFGPINAVLYNTTTQTLLHIPQKMAQYILDKSIDRLPKRVLEMLIPDSLNFIALNPDRKTGKLIQRICLDMTDKCNFKCKNCFHKDVHEGSTVGDSVTRWIDSIPNKENIELCLLGGEPFLVPRSRLKELICKWEKHFNKLTIYTNGSLVDADWIEFLKGRNVRLRLTFYSLTHDTHDFYTGIPGAYESTKNLVKALKAQAIELKLNLIFNKSDANKFQNEDNWIKESCANTFLDIRRPSSPKHLSRSDCQLIKDKLEFNPSNYRPLTALSYENILQNISYHPCYCGKLFIAINGDVYRCIWDQCNIITNIKDVNLKKSLAKQFKWDIPIHERYSTCSICEFSFLCFDCPVANDIPINNNTVDKPYFCRYLPQEGKYDDR